MILLRLFYEFFKTGLFSVGGGMATIPFLQHMGETTGWFTNQDLTTMIAVSGVHTGPAGGEHGHLCWLPDRWSPRALVATLGVITPGAILILIIAGFLQKFRSNRSVEAVFAGLRPASTALIAAAGLSVAYSVFTASDALSPNSFPAIQWTAVVLTLAMFAAMKWTPLKKLHPIAFIAAGAAAGIFTSALNEKVSSSHGGKRALFLFRLFIGGQGLIVQIRQGPGLIG